MNAFSSTFENYGNFSRNRLNVKKIRKRAGNIRDLDVLTGHLLKLDVTGEQDCIVELLEAFGVQRAKKTNELRKLVLEYRSQLRRRLKQSSRKLDKLLNRAGEPNLAADAAAKALQLTADVKIPAKLNSTNLHPHRLKVKALQYVLQLSDRPEQQEFIGKLRDVKDAIGEWHDWEELIAIASDTLEHGVQCKLLPKLKAISKEKYERALSLTNQMRSQFLGLKTSGSSIKRPGTRAVYSQALSAAASAAAR